MPISKRFQGVTIVLDSMALPAIARVTYTWRPTDAPSARPTTGQLAVRVTSGTVQAMLDRVRAAIIAQESAADGGSHTVTEG